jgi:uncharacterized membrane protein
LRYFLRFKQFVLASSIKIETQELMNPTKKLKLDSINPVFSMTAVSILVLFFFSSLRHSLFRSNSLDLGFFDQGIYLISQDLTPISSFLNFHILGDHAAFIIYPLSIFYKIYPDVHWLFLIQAIALSSGSIPVFGLARQQGLTNNQGYLASLIYLLSPIIFNANLFDFHPDVIAVPFFLWALLWAKLDKVLQFCLAVIIVLSCKAVFALTIMAMGIWLVWFEKKYLMGTIAIVIGAVWFITATQIIIPLIGGESASTMRHVGRYASLGSSYTEILKNLFWKPNLFFSKIFSTDSLIYLLLLFAPFIWYLRLTNLSPLIATFPTVFMSILSNDPNQRYLTFQYPLPILPFLMLIAISGISMVGSQKRWHLRFLASWAALAFITMSLFQLFTGESIRYSDTWQSNNEAIALVKTQGSILTTDDISPHVTHRQEVKLAFSNPPPNLEQFDYILLNTRHPKDQIDRDYLLSLVEKAKKISSLKIDHQKDDVYLFTK